VSADLDDLLAEDRLSLCGRLGTVFGRIAQACQNLPDDRVERVVRTLEHAAEVLEVEAGR